MTVMHKHFSFKEPPNFTSSASYFNLGDRCFHWRAKWWRDWI